MKKIIASLALSFCFASAISLSSCVYIVDPEQLYSSLLSNNQTGCSCSACINASSSSTETTIVYEEVATAEAFVAAISEGENVKLTEDIELAPAEGSEDDAAAISIPEETEVTINLNGNTLSAAEKVEGEEHYYVIENAGELTLTGEGTLSGKGVLNTGSLIVEADATIQSVDATDDAAIWNTGTVHIKGGNFQALHEGTADDSAGPSCLNNQSTGTVIIDGGNFESNNYHAYAIISSGTITINEATVVTSNQGAIAIEDGTATINGGSFSSTQDYALYVSAGTVTINDGTFSGSETYENDIYIETTATVTLNGGTFVRGGIYNDGTLILTGEVAVTAENIKGTGTVTDNRGGEGEQTE